jgi:hypothetical protein
VSFFKKLFGLESKKQNLPRTINAKFLDSQEETISHTMPMKKHSLPQQHYIIKHNDQYLVYNSKDEMPEDLREHIEEVEHIDSLSSVYNIIVDGKKKQYTRYADIPQEIRSVIEKKNT